MSVYSKQTSREEWSCCSPKKEKEEITRLRLKFDSEGKKTNRQRERQRETQHAATQAAATQHAARSTTHDAAVRRGTRHLHLQPALQHQSLYAFHCFLLGSLNRVPFDGVLLSISCVGRYGDGRASKERSLAVL